MDEPLAKPCITDVKFEVLMDTTMVANILANNKAMLGTKPWYIVCDNHRRPDPTRAAIGEACEGKVQHVPHAEQ